MKITDSIYEIALISLPPVGRNKGWGSLRRLQFNFVSFLNHVPTPTPALPTRGRGINNDQRTEELIGRALKELALG